MALAFDNHSFDPNTGELSGPRGAARLQPKPARLLGLLLAAGGALVEREAIRAELWPDTTVDFDAGLNTCVRQIRAALEQSGGDPEWIETLPKRGYRSNVAVARGDGSRAQGVQLRAIDGGPGSAPRELPMSARRYVALALIVAAMAAAAVAGWTFAGLPPGDDAGSRAARLAILPFNDPDSEDAIDFNRALGQAFVAALTNADPDNLVVIGPATTGRMLLAGLSPAQIAEQVAAEYILLGGHRAADHSTFVQVLVAPGAEHLFARRFEIEENQPAHAPAEVVAAITEAIREARAADRRSPGDRAPMP